MCPERQILLEIIWRWLYSMLQNMKIVPNTVLKASKSLRWGEGPQTSCCAPAPLPRISGSCGNSRGTKILRSCFSQPQSHGCRLEAMDTCLGQLQAAVRGAPTLPAGCVRPGWGVWGTRDALGRACGRSTGYPAVLEGASPYAWLGGSLLPGVWGRGWSPPRSLRLPSKAAQGRACCQRGYSWPSSAHLSALRESSVISSAIKGLGACSTSLKKQENNNNNNELYSGTLPSGVRIAFNAFWRRKLFMLQP